MPSYNRILLLGHLTRDPQISYLRNQTPVVDFGIATNYRWYSKKDGTQHDEVCFVDCKAFGNKATIINAHLTTGSPIFIDGRLTFEQWVNKENGEKRNKHRVIVQGFQFLGGEESNKEEPVETTDPVGNKHRTDETEDDKPF